MVVFDLWSAAERGLSLPRQCPKATSVARSVSGPT